MLRHRSNVCFNSYNVNSAHNLSQQSKRWCANNPAVLCFFALMILFWSQKKKSIFFKKRNIAFQKTQKRWSTDEFHARSCQIAFYEGTKSNFGRVGVYLRNNGSPFCFVFGIANSFKLGVYSWDRFMSRVSTNLISTFHILFVDKIITNKIVIPFVDKTITNKIVIPFVDKTRTNKIVTLIKWMPTKM